MSEDVELEGKKLEIVKYAFGRFYESGFHATGMEAALAGSGISKRTLYKYFPSKEDLIEAVLALYSEAVVQQLFGPVAHISDPREQIIAFFDVRKVAGRMLTRGCLGVKAAQGRLLTASDDTVSGGNPVVVLSYPYWQTYMGSDARVVGETISINGVPARFKSMPDCFGSPSCRDLPASSSRCARVMPMRLRAPSSSTMSMKPLATIGSSYWLI